MAISLEADPTLAQGYIKINGTTAATVTASGIVSGGVPAGAVMAFARSTAPAGWLVANGNTVPNGSGTVQNVTADFSALYAAVSTSFGAAGTLPDLQGIFVRGSGSQTISGITYNKTFAAKEGDAFQGHMHQLNMSAGDSPTGNGGVIDGPTGNNSDVFVKGAITDGTNGTPRTASETRPANVALLYCIKY
jgi:microcystin-dependent protein